MSLEIDFSFAQVFYSIFKKLVKLTIETKNVTLTRFSAYLFQVLGKIDEGPTRLLAGFAKGHLLEYDLTTGKLLRKLDDAHPLGSAIIRARFTHEKALALICDSGGSVFELSLKKTLGVRSYSSRCIFSGSRGEVCTFEPLNQVQNQLATERIIVALATISKVIGKIN